MTTTRNEKWVPALYRNSFLGSSTVFYPFETSVPDPMHKIWFSNFSEALFLSCLKKSGSETPNEILTGYEQMLIKNHSKRSNTGQCIMLIVVITRMRDYTNVFVINLSEKFSFLICLFVRWKLKKYNNL